MELKPCPFCGSHPNGFKGSRYCSNENCVMTPDCEFTDEQWNTRTPDAAQSARIADLTEAAQAMIKAVNECDVPNTHAIGVAAGRLDAALNSNGKEGS